MSVDKDKAASVALREKIDSIVAAIGPIVEAHAESEKAHADKLAAEIDLVSTMLQLAQPVVRAIGTRPKLSENATSATSATTQLASWRGLVLTCRPREALSHKGLEPERHEAESHRKGTYGGSHVFLREDGRLAALFYEGGWNVDEHAYGQDEWRTTEREISVEAFCRNWASDADPKKLAAHLLKFIEKAGDRQKSITKARELADKYRAIVTLL
jgi:hypothetical protein